MIPLPITIVALWALALAVKLSIAYGFPLFADEAYYWVWSKHLSLSYFDHPPFVAWILSIGRALEPFGNSIRWPIVIVGHSTALIWLKLLQPTLSREKLLLWFLICLLNPMTGVGSIVATPDVPLAFFWSLSILFLLRGLDTRKLIWYLAFGAVAGLGFCAKYHMVLFLPIALIFISFERRWKEVVLAYLPVTFLMTILFAGPVLVWNQQHDWASFKFQLNHGLGKATDLSFVGEYLGAQIGLIFPTILFLALRPKRLMTHRWALYFGWTPVVFFFISSFRGRVEPNWTSIALPSLFLLAVLKSSGHRLIKGTLAIWGMGLILLVSQLMWTWLPIDNSTLKVAEFDSYDIFIPYSRRYRPMYASSYQMASSLYYKTKTPTFKLNGVSRRDHFDFMPESRPHGDEFYVIMSVWNDSPDWLKLEYRQDVILDNLPMEMRLLRFVKR